MVPTIVSGGVRVWVERPWKPSTLIYNGAASSGEWIKLRMKISLRGIIEKSCLSPLIYRVYCPGKELTTSYCMPSYVLADASSVNCSGICASVDSSSGLCSDQSRYSAP
ncbi:hypothetical protein EVAR_54586_1 [Eumeta japonica]|uniref:Uncharacterized protein n=1 Tax=Eumeta variegata TaxID=151549 RepID=A0A4C1YQI8_EUMVA|nr:hypothetical protein EVAR_54586_1 [Eumeta japonica]